MLELIVFLSGAVVMILELVGSRILAPFVGNSIFVWTSLIGIILGSLSLGYYLGGRFADKKTKKKILTIILFLSALLIALIVVVKNPILGYIQTNIKDLRLASILSATILFAPASIVLGMISPYAIRLKIENVSSSGKTVGSLYAISTLGSIAGTFLAGFVLISFFGSTNLLIILSIIMMLNGLISTIGKKQPGIQTAMVVLILIIGFALPKYVKMNAPADIIEIDTTYNHVKIYNTQNYQDLKPIKLLQISTERHSAMYLDSDDLVFDYTKFYKLAEHFFPNFKESLLIGGGAYSWPKEYIASYPEATLDVVEIDPKLTELAKTYFKLKENPRLNIYHEDGRTYLNRTKEKYDVVFIDAFQSSYSIPYQLTTLETAQRIHEILNDNGVVLMNLISSIEGEDGKFLRAEYYTYKEVFPQVYIFPVHVSRNEYSHQNIILAAFKDEELPSFNSDNETLNSYLSNLWTYQITNDMPILTDDYAPVDQYILNLI